MYWSSCVCGYFTVCIQTKHGIPFVRQWIKHASNSGLVIHNFPVHTWTFWVRTELCALGGWRETVASAAGLVTGNSLAREKSLGWDGLLPASARQLKPSFPAPFDVTIVWVILEKPDQVKMWIGFQARARGHNDESFNEKCIQSAWI